MWCDNEYRDTPISLNEDHSLISWWSLHGLKINVVGDIPFAVCCANEIDNSCYDEGMGKGITRGL